MYVLEVSDFMFFINCIKNPTSALCMTAEPDPLHGLKLKCNTTFTNKQCHFYFNCIYRLWNSIPLINMDLSTFTIKNQLKQFFRNHFITNFNSTDTHKLHYLYAPVAPVLTILSQTLNISIVLITT